MRPSIKQEFSSEAELFIAAFIKVVLELYEVRLVKM